MRAASGERMRPHARATESALLSGSLASLVYLDLRSTGDMMMPLGPAPIIVSASQSAMRLFSATMAGRWSMSTRFGMKPRPEVLPLRLLYFLPLSRDNQDDERIASPE